MYRGAQIGGLVVLMLAGCQEGQEGQFGEPLAETVPLVGVSPVPVASSTEGPTLYVSLTFDDNRANTYEPIRDIIGAAGYQATLYVNSGKVGRRRAPEEADYNAFLTWRQLEQLRNDGHEIGGHTKGHVNLAQLGPQQIADTRAQICADKRELTRRGFSAKSFAFPFGATSAQARAILDECGYQTGRRVSGLNDENRAERVPLPFGQRYNIRAYPSINNDEITDVLQRLVDAHTYLGEQGWDEGWVPLTFHHITPKCRTTGGTALSYCWTEENLQMLVTWLSSDVEMFGVPKPPGWNVRVVRVDEVDATLEARDYLVTNSSMDTPDGDGSSCFQRLPASQSGVTYAREDEGEPHNIVETVQRDEDAQGEWSSIVIQRDEGACSIFAQRDRSYELSLDFMVSDVEAADLEFVVYGRDPESVVTCRAPRCPNGTEDYFGERCSAEPAWIELTAADHDGGDLTAALDPAAAIDAWQTVTVRIDRLAPAFAIDTLSFGLRLRGAGRLAVDNFVAREL